MFVVEAHLELLKEHSSFLVVHVIVDARFRTKREEVALGIKKQASVRLACFLSSGHVHLNLLWGEQRACIHRVCGVSKHTARCVAHLPDTFSDPSIGSRVRMFESQGEILASTYLCCAQKNRSSARIGCRRRVQRNMSISTWFLGECKRIAGAGGPKVHGAHYWRFRLLFSEQCPLGAPETPIFRILSRPLLRRHARLARRADPGG